MSHPNFIKIASVSCLMILAACSPKFQVVFPLSNQHSSSGSTVSSSAHSLPSDSSSASSLPVSVLIKVPFQSQAPLNNWDAVHEQSCEEASLILVHFYLNGNSITPQQMEVQISGLISFETQNGYKQDVTIEQLKEIASKMYGLQGSVLSDVSIQTLKQQLANGHPVILPLAGRMLKNPYFSGDGPWYHMLVVVGYDGTSFITNDVGTKRGLQYHYDYNTLINAIHDWTGTDDMIASGPKRMLILWK